MTTSNGRPARPSLKRLRRQLEGVRAEQEIARLRAETSILENTLGWSRLDPFEFTRDSDWGWPQMLAAGDRASRRDGYNRPFVWSEIDLDLMRSQARWIATKNPEAIGALRSLTNFTIRTGYTYEVEPGKHAGEDRSVAEAVSQVQEVVDEFLDLNNWSSRERSVFLRSVRDGDALLRHFRQDDGTTLVRFVEPEQLIRPPGSDSSYAMGIRTDPEDVERVLSYAVTYGNPDDIEEVPADEVSHLKRNVDECVKRGLSDFYSTGEAFDGAQKLLRNMRETGAVQAAIAWIEQFESASGTSVRDSITAARDQNRTYYPDPITGKETNYQKYGPGTIPKVGKGRTYVPAPLATSTTQHISIVQACLRALGTRWNMPEYLISGDASNANYSSTLVSGSPFVIGVETEQAEYERYFLRCLWVAIRNACSAGRVRVGSRALTFREVQRLVDLKATPPQVAIANKAEESQIDSKDIADGVMSKQERRRRRGLDDTQMRQEIAEEPVQPPTPPGGGMDDLAAMLGGGGGKPPSMESLVADLKGKYGEKLTEWLVRSAAQGAALLEADEGDGGTLTDANADEYAELMAELLYGLYGDDALKAMQDGDVQESVLREAWDALAHPRGPNGRFIPKGSGEAGAAAKETIAKVLRGEGGDPKQVAEHLSILSVKQLRELHKEHGKPIPGRLRQQLVDAVKARLPVEGAKGEQEKPGAKGQDGDGATGQDAGGKDAGANGGVQDQETPIAVKARLPVEGAKKEEPKAAGDVNDLLDPAKYATKQEYIDAEVKRLKPILPDDDEEVLRAQAEMWAADRWVPPQEKGKYEVGQTVSVDGEIGSYRGTFTHTDGKKYAVIASGKGGQYSVPVEKVEPGNFTMPRADMRQPHEKTWAERRTELLQGYMSGGRTQATPGELRAMKKEHHDAVASALYNGRRVPPEVLADYPDLAPQPQPAAQPAATPATGDRLTFKPSADTLPTDAQRAEARDLLARLGGDATQADAVSSTKGLHDAVNAAKPKAASSSQYEYAKPSSIDTPSQAVLNDARKAKENAHKRVLDLRQRIKDEPLGGNRHGLRLELLKAESAHGDAVMAERGALQAIERRANELGKTTIRSTATPAPTTPAATADHVPTTKPGHPDYEAAAAAVRDAHGSVRDRDGLATAHDLYAAAKQRHPGLTPATFKDALVGMQAGGEAELHTRNEVRTLTPEQASVTPFQGDRAKGFVMLKAR